MPYQKWRPARKIVVFGLALMFVLSACNGQNSQPAEAGEGPSSGDAVVSQAPVQEEAPPAPKNLDSDAEENLAPSLDPVAEGSPVTPTAVPEQMEPDPTDEPTPVEESAPSDEKVFVASDRPLGSTNPSEVNLATGQYQFVEFFAYW